jgi:hypothetical protein
MVIVALWRTHDTFRQSDNKQSEVGMSANKEGRDENHTLPPDQPLPSDELSTYTLGHDEHDETEIVNYVNGQCRGEETVHYVERIKTEFVGGERFDAWDVHTDVQRWWVLTNMTNLYPQAQFPSLDYTLSFHIGLMQRILAKQDNGENEPTPFLEVHRRHDEVAELIIKAIEAEEFQSAGMRLRECLISLTGATRRQLQLPNGGEFPKDADVQGWNEVLIDHLCGGKSNKALRQYLKTVSNRTWQLVGWLTHDRNANKTEAIIAHEAVGTQIGHFIQLVIRNRVDHAEKCPMCSSRSVTTYYDPMIGEDGAYYQRCRSCDWTDHPG